MTGNYFVQVHHVWQHDIERLRRSDKNLQKIWGDKELWKFYEDPIDPRSAMAGGRTESVCALIELTQEQIEKGWTIEHVDITRY